MKTRTGKIIIAGGSGFLGTSLAAYLTGLDYEVVILTRAQAHVQHGVRYEQWDAKSLGDWQNEFEGAFAVINLTGKSVDCRYTQKNKDEILSSRLDSTRVIGQVIQHCKQAPQVWLNSSSATIYDDSRIQFMDEETGIIGDDFSMNVCKAWEKIFYEQDTPHTRKLALRTSIVLGNHGGAFKPLVNLAKVGLGGKQGDGEQFVSWLHIDDFNRIIAWLLMHEHFSGTVNCVSPAPVENHEFMTVLRKAVGRSFGFNLPKWALTIGAVFMQTEAELILKSRKVIPKRLLAAGFQFVHPTLEGAIASLVYKKVPELAKTQQESVALP